MTGYRDCDYFEDESGDIYIVRGDRHPAGLVRAKLIYEKSPDGERIRPDGRRYQKKNQQDEIVFVAADRLRAYFWPLDNPIRNKLNGIWLKIYEQLKKFVPESDIGIFGSTLLDFPVIRDVDFIVYGLDNCRRIKTHIKEIKSALAVPGISPDHIDYQRWKFSASHNPLANSLAKTLANKWCTMQIAPGISNTLMFGYQPEEIIPWLDADDRPGQEIIIEGEVLDDIFTNFSPRIFQVRADDASVYTIKTYFWAYHACVKVGDEVRIAGKLIADGIILLNDYDHGVIIK